MIRYSDSELATTSTSWDSQFQQLDVLQQRGLQLCLGARIDTDPSWLSRTTAATSGFPPATMPTRVPSRDSRRSVTCPNPDSSVASSTAILAPVVPDHPRNLRAVGDRPETSLLGSRGPLLDSQVGLVNVVAGR